MKRTAFLGLLALGSTSGLAQQSIKPHPLGATNAVSKELLGSATLARQLPNGSVIVNDGLRRRLLLLDPTLQSFAVIADSTAGSVNGYGQRPGALIPYVADSTLYLDATAGSFLVIDPVGKVVRVMSPPRPSDNNFLTVTAFGFPGFDAKGRMVYRSSYPRQMQQTRDGNIQMAPAPDSAPVLRVDLDTRKADTIAALKTPRMIASSVTMPGGGTMMMNTQAPLPLVDDWALLSDGSIALIRGRDYHIDWILADGTKKSTDRISFEWKRLSDDEKLAVIDSIAKARASMQAGGGPGGAGPVAFGGDGGGMRMMVGRGGDAGGGGRGSMVFDQVVTPGAPAPAPAAAGAPATATPQGKAPEAGAKPAANDAKPAGNDAKPAGNDAKPAAMSNPNNAAPVGERGAVEQVKSAMAGMPPSGFASMPLPAASDVPDYVPPFNSSSARPDADANLWVRTTTPGSSPGNVVYDVINNKGELTDRVDVPRGMSIVGFGRGGIVYLTQRDANGLHLVRATIR